MAIALRGSSPMTDLTVVVCVAFDHRACPVGLAKFKGCVLHCPFVDNALEVAGSFDLIVQLKCSSLVEYTDYMDSIRAQLAEFVTRLETNFVAKKIDPKHELKDRRVLWLPCDHGIRRVDAHLIDKITAEGDYMRVHVGEWNCLVHQTMQRFSEQLGSSGFVKLHRSALVRIGFVERLVHDDQWRWKAQLRDGTHLSVAKGHIKEVLRLITSESSNVATVSSDTSHPNEKCERVNEDRVKTSA
jgi:hypothetical protein